MKPIRPMMLAGACAAAAITAGTAKPAVAQVQDPVPLSSYRDDTHMRWFSFENADGAKGRGGMENRGAKGHAFDSLPAGQSVTLAHVNGAGTVRRIWMTIDDRSPERRRNLWIEMYWDGASKPAVSVPLGDFFMQGEGPVKPMENALVASPEGRSFESFIPMPFRKSAKIVLVNKGNKDLTAVFYDVDITKQDSQPDDALYFHAYWHRQNRTKLGEPFQVLPHVTGHGRYLGTYVAEVTNPDYGNSWFGEGELKVYLDGDDRYPTLVGTGTEDLIGAGYGQGEFINRYTGAPVANLRSRQQTFYRLHIPDPIYFADDIRVDLPQIGGAPRQDFLRMQKAGVPIKPITVDPGGRAKFIKLFEQKNTKPVGDPETPNGWVNFFREDDVAAVAYYYLDRPGGDVEGS
ncbi:glycoside hydrolase family 172 protein [Stakelama saccharophila]|uniref:Glycoside hydrolase family 172 protein n=1 Tax=Stakelama saccharophila TaxID=3075605 RepID=A0ABZ0B528_9SPHN|nr:glycoside hydrolase family 172 protein [Stakelama sp. W311]WNO52429.1 glycoside hydrolase family 172 protein [Stakelama sp. W311]